MSKERYNRSVSDADAAFSRWCGERGVPLHTIEHVVTWEAWDDGIGVYFFLRTISDADALSPDQREHMKNAYLGFLEDAGYPFGEFPNVVFEIDSDENVRKNYAGSYFHRLR